MSATYTGKVAKTECSVVTYTAIFGSEELPPAEQDAEESTQPEIPAPDINTDTDNRTETDTVPMETSMNTEVLSILGCVGGVSALAATVLWSVQKIKERSARK